MSLLLLVVTASVLYSIYRILQKPRNLPPGPSTYSLPIFGHLLKLGKHPQETLMKWCSESKSDIIHCYFGHKLVIVLNNYALIKEAFMDDNYSARAQPFIFEEHFRGKGLTYAEGERWVIHRKFAMDSLRKFGMGKYFLQDTVLDEIKDICHVIDQQKGKPFNIKGLLTHGLSNIICGFAFGQRFTQDNEEFRRIVGLIEECFTLGSHDSWITVFPLLRFIPIRSLGGNYKQFSKNFNQLFAFAKQLVTEHEHSGNDDDDEAKDYIDEFLRKAKQDELSQKIDSTFDTDQLITSITNLFIGGTETTSTTLRWALVYMIENPDVLERVQQEIDQHMSNTTNQMYVRMEDRQFLPYTTATILEIQRCGNIATLGGSTMHRNLGDAMLNGYHIPKNSYVAANFYAVHVDHRQYLNPYTFDPTRFLSQDRQSVQRPAAFIPFSIGKKSCPGESLANMELFLFFTNLVKQYNFDAPKKSQQINSSKFYHTSLTRAPYDFDVSFVTRFS